MANLSLGTVNGVDLKLTSPVTDSSGNKYYYLDVGNISRSSIDTLFNNGSDTVDTSIESPRFY